jgi:ribulose-phosphate 3-epimerase
MTRGEPGLSASVTCMNPLTYRETIQSLDAAGLTAYHIDVCDGQFAKTFLLYPALLPSFREVTSTRLDVHLYCFEPSLYIDEFVKCGADSIIVQLEAHESYAQIIPRIARLGVRAGLGILPGTPIPQSVREVLPALSMVVANTVGPAYAGQQYNPEGVETITRMRAICDEAGATPEIVVDGAVNEKRLENVFSAGADHLVLGTSSVFKNGADWGKELRAFRAIAEASFKKFGRHFPD